ncbi:MAG: hypothetical protein ACQEQR_07240, partial [Pseudomonadota bacterium]
MSKKGANKSPRSIKQPQSFQTRFLCPKYWGIWLGIGLLKIVSLLPLSFKFKIGKGLGKILFYLATKRRRLALTNIQLCFPDKTPTEQQAILQAHFESLGIGLIEMAMVWWGDHKQNHAHARERELVHFIGEDNLYQAQQTGKGVLILA